LFEAFEVMLTLPVTAPFAGGVNDTAKDVLCPAASVTGENPLTLKPVPLALAAETTTLVCPEFVNVSDKLVLLPAWILPNERLVGLAISVPWATTPVALSGIVKFGFVPFEVMLTLPVTAPFAVGVNDTAKDVLCPAASVTGENPLTLKPVPLALVAETKTLVCPEFVNVSDTLVLLPTWTLPNEKLVGLALSVPGATPVALSGIAKFGFAPFDVIFRVPLAAPPVVGVNSTAKDMLCPAASVTGENPLKLKPVPLALAAETDTLVCPEFVNVSDTLVLLPTWTLPNEKLVGLAISVPGATPVALSGIMRLGLVPFEVMFTLPLAAPLAIGAKSTAKVVLCPGASDTGENPLKLKPLPLALTAEIERLVPPVLVNVSDKLVLLPTWTLPNARLVALGDKVPGAIPLPDKLTDTGFPFPWFEPVVPKATLPLKEPDAGGAKVTAMDVEEPAPNTSGNEMLPIANPFPLIVALFTVTSDPPEFVRTTILVW
jgi:hypothetical protein